MSVSPLPIAAAAGPSRLSSATLAGVACALLTVTLWAQWVVSTRYAAHAHLPAAWVGLMRYGVPALVLAPFWWRGGLLPRGLDWRLVATMVAGCGAPFFLVVSEALEAAPAAAAGVMLMGALPFFAALLTWRLEGERFAPVRLAGFAAILAALVCIGVGQGIAGGVGARLALLPMGAFLWAGYTLAFRRSGLPALQAAGLIAAWSTLLLLPLALWQGPGALLAAEPWVLGWQLFAQGVLSGVVALVSYGLAVRRLGASRTAAFGALSPALAALFAIPALGEVPTAGVLAGVALAVAGVVLASGAIKGGNPRRVPPVDRHPPAQAAA